MLFDGLVAVLNADSSAGVDGSSSLNVRVGVDGGRVGTNASSGNGNGGSGGVVQRKTRVGKRSTSQTVVAEEAVVAESVVAEAVVAEEAIGQGELSGSSSNQNNQNNLKKKNII